MINLPESTKNQYKDYDREMQVFGNLYLAEKRASSNLLKKGVYVSLYNSTYNDGVVTQVQADSNNNPTLKLQFRNNNTYIGEDNYRPNIALGHFNWTFTKTSSFNRIIFAVNGSQRDTNIAFDVSGLENNKTYNFGARIINKTQGSITWQDMYISASKNYYEEYGVSVVDYTSNSPTSNNILDQKEYTSTYNTRLVGKSFIQISEDTNNNPYIEIQKKINGTNSTVLESKRIQLGIIDFQFTFDGTYNEINYKVNGSQIDTVVTFNTNILTIGKTYHIGATFTDIEQGSITWQDMYISENDTHYELYNSSPFKLTEENKCKILSFNINEKYDVYLTSLPYNEMTIEVDNENGYFTDYSPNCILSKLNNDCYIDLFMKINDDKYYKIMTMNFNEVVSTNYENAKLSFRSSLSKLSTLPLKDKEYKFFSLDGDYMSNYDVIKFFANNYDISLINKWSAINYMDVTNPNHLYDLLLSSMFWLTFLTTDYNNNVVFKLVSDYELPQETVEKISNNLQLDRPAIKKGRDYDILIKKFDWDIQSEQREYYNEISGKLTSKTDTIVIPPRDWNLRELTSADITYEGNITVTKHIPTMYIPAVLVLEISGEIGETYRIIINKQNVTYDNIKGEIEDKIYKYRSEYDENKKIVLDTRHQVGVMYYECLFNITPIIAKIEVKCIGLPYLEIGDIIEIENYLTTTIKMAITDLDINYDGGLTMTIKGYSFDWNVLFPSDDLYPSDTLYPNTQQSTRGGVRRG